MRIVSVVLTVFASAAAEVTIIKDFEAGTVTFEDESCRKVLHVGRHIMQSRHFHQVDRTVIASLAAREGACIDMDSLPAHMPAIR